MCRPVVMHTWPWCRKEPAAPAATVAARSASSRTTIAELPPSSRWTFLRLRDAAAPTARPAGVEPVKEMTGTRGSSTRAAPTSAPAGSTDSTPAGRPACSKMRARATPPQTAVRGSGLRITALPRASAGATDRMARIRGKLNGAMTPTTPTGTRFDMLRRGASLGRISPSACEGRAAPSKHSCAATCVSSWALGRREPDSRMIQRSISSACRCHRSPARRSTAARSVCGRAAQSRWAATARSTARSRSPSSARPTLPSVAPVAGSTTLISPAPPGIQSPAKIFPCQMDSSRSAITNSLCTGAGPAGGRSGARGGRGRE